MTALFNRRTLFAELMLLNIAVAWGLGFPLMKDAMALHGIWTLLWLRFALAALLVLPFALRRARDINRSTVLAGAVLGVLLFLAFAFLIGGLQYTSAANTGFLAGLTMLFVPLLERLLWRRPLHAGVKWSVLLGLLGLAVLSQVHAVRPGLGDVLVLVGAVFSALQIIATDKLAPRHNAEWLTVVQLVLAATLFAAACIPTGQPLWPAVCDGGLWRALLLTAGFATAFAFLVQMRFQEHTTPQRAALIFNLEPLFGALFAWWLLGEHIGGHVWLGGLLIVAAMMVSGLWPQKPQAAARSQ